MPDSKLQLAMEEVKAILKKHDIAGAAILVSPDNGEHLQAFEASWNCCYFDPIAGYLRIRAKLADFGGDEEKWTKAMTCTVHMLQCMEQFGAMLSGNGKQILGMLRQHLEIDGGPQQEHVNPGN